MLYTWGMLGNLETYIQGNESSTQNVRNFLIRIYEYILILQVIFSDLVTHREFLKF